MNRKIQRTDVINSKADTVVINSDDLNNIKMKSRIDLKSTSKFKETIDTKSNNKLKESDLKNNKKITDVNNCKSNDLKMNNNIKVKDIGDVNYKIKDRGDLKVVMKANEARLKKNEIVKHKIINPDGDTQYISVNQRPEKIKINESTKQSNVKNEGLKSIWNKRTVVRNAQTLATVDLKRIRDRYTMKLRNPPRPAALSKKENNSMNTELKNATEPNKKESKGGSVFIHKKEQLTHSTQKIQNLPQIPQTINALPHVAQKIHDSSHVAQKIHENIAQKIQDLPQIPQNIHALPQAAQKIHDSSHVAQKIHENIAQKTQDLPLIKPHVKEARKKPVIRTIMTRNGSTRIYKAVTFEEDKMKPTTLEINIPNDSLRKPNSMKSIDVNSLKSKVTVSKISVKEKKVVPKKCSQKRDRKHRRHLPSRDCSVQDILARSPPTEVAKWAPTSITPQTKPYYEAWVDTTLTAVSKSERLKNDKITILKCLQALERPETPELFYCNYADERYAGRIKIHTR